MRYVALVTMVLLASLAGCGGGEEAGGPAPAADGASTSSEMHWPQFRGAAGDGVAPVSARPPAKIDPAVDIRWRTPISADGSSSPICIGERIFLTGEGRRILAFDRRDGRALWSTALTVPDADVEIDTGEYGSASATACSDGERVFAFFGDGVVGAVDLEGRQIWAKRLISSSTNTFGFAASPVVRGGVLVQIIDQEPDDTGETELDRSFIVGLRASDGRELWRRARPVYSSWSTPLPIDEGGRDALITCASPWVIAYAWADGAELWRAGGIDGDVAASPVADVKRVYAFSDPSGALLAIRRGGRGDITDTHIAWTFDEDLPDVASALCVGGRLTFCSDFGALRCLDAETGKPLWRIELDTTVYTSPILAGGRIILIDTDGRLFMIDPADGRILDDVELGEAVNASPAAVGQFLYVRTDKQLICIGTP